MNLNWERRHPCRRGATVIRKLAGKMPALPVSPGSWPQCAIGDSLGLSRNAFGFPRIGTDTDCEARLNDGSDSP